jgi:hypothetical protein
MEEELLIAVIAALLNILFSILIPPLLSNSKLPFTNEIKKHYECNKQFILISTILTIILVYISLNVSPYIKLNFFENISELNKVSQVKIPDLPLSQQQLSSPSQLAVQQQLSSPSQLAVQQQTPFYVANPIVY